VVRRRSPREQFTEEWLEMRQASVQRFLLQAIERVAPWVLDDLRSSVLPVGGSSWDPRAAKEWPPDLAPNQQEALEKWAARFNLNAPWALLAAQETLMAWCLNPSLVQESPLRFVPVLAGTHVGRLTAGVDPECLGDMEDLRKRVGGARRRAKKEVPTSMPSDWFEWAALYLCGKSKTGRLGLTYEEILNEPGFPVEDWSLRQAVTKVLRVCGLRHPHPQGGRPKHSS
jgi:hypothetical protein